LKLLADENLPPRLVRDLADLFPDSMHVFDLGLGSTPDALIWEYAQTQGFTFLTKDKDFAQLSIVRGSPPKVIRNNAIRFADFESDARRSLLVLR
jgi:predicted nuclease of predicted toxin-antitoxin system